MDILPLILIPIVYASIAFYGLGDKQNPESFCQFTEKGRCIISSCRIPVHCYVLFGLFTELNFLQFSLDGEKYTDESTMEQKYSDIFKWNEAKAEHSL